MPRVCSQSSSSTLQDRSRVPRRSKRSPKEYPGIHISGKQISLTPRFLALPRTLMIRSRFPLQSPTVWFKEAAATWAAGGEMVAMLQPNPNQASANPRLPQWPPRPPGQARMFPVAVSQRLCRRRGCPGPRRCPDRPLLAMGLQVPKGLGARPKPGLWR